MCMGASGVLEGRDGVGGQHAADGDDRDRGRHRQGVDDGVGQGQAPGVDDGQAERGQRPGEAEAEDDDQQHPERDLVLGDRAEQDDERGGAGDQARRGAHGEQALPAHRVVVVVMVVLLLPAPQDAEPDGDHDQPRGEVQVGEEVLGQDVGSRARA